MKATDFNERVRCFVYRWFSRNPFTHIKTMELQAKAKEHFGVDITAKLIRDSINAYEDSINNHSLYDEKLCKETIGDDIRGFHRTYWLERKPFRKVS